jgi:carbon monoxide dehydrogenase subunit G
MEMTGEQRIEAPRATVWAALNDPDVLRQCIPGCQSLEKIAEDRMRGVVAVKVGPISARFAGEVTLSDLDPPNGYRIEGEGQGGVAGFAKGGAKVRLSDDGAATLLGYEVSVQVGGKLAQLGGAIIDATAKSMAASFFKRLSELAAPAPEPPAGPGPAAGPSPPGHKSHADAPSAPSAIPPSPQLQAGPPMAWILAVAAGVLGGFLIGRDGGQIGVSVLASLTVALLVIVVGAAAFHFGRRAAGPGQVPVIVLDPVLLARLTAPLKEPKP